VLAELLRPARERAQHPVIRNGKSASVRGSRDRVRGQENRSLRRFTLLTSERARHRPFGTSPLSTKHTGGRYGKVIQYLAFNREHSQMPYLTRLRSVSACLTIEQRFQRCPSTSIPLFRQPKISTGSINTWNLSRDASLHFRTTVYLFRWDKWDRWDT
jgi:hypothetical protein